MAGDSINSLLSFYLETFDAIEQFVGNGAFHSDIRPMGQNVNPAYLTALQSALLREKAHNIAATDFVLLPLTYI